MKKIFLTGGTGFVGSNIKLILGQWYEIDAPARNELDVKDAAQVLEYVKRGNYDIIIHSANSNPAKNSLDQKQNMLEDSLRAFMNIYKVRGMVQKVLYFGSGAEFDKTRDIVMAKEESISQSIPKDTYGFAKYIMNSLARGSGNVYNLRLFGCYGGGDHESKFITHAIRCCLGDSPITIRQDCVFDYIHVSDVAYVVRKVIEEELVYQDYNVCSGIPIRLSEIAQKVRSQMGVEHLSIDIKKDGLNKAYTAFNGRLRTLMGAGWEPVSIDEGIRLQIRYEREMHIK